MMFNILGNFIDLLGVKDPLKIQEIQKKYLQFKKDIYIGVSIDVELHKNRDLNNLPRFEEFQIMLELKTS